MSRLARYVCGVDLSTKTIHLAAIPLDQGPPVVIHEDLPAYKVGMTNEAARCAAAAIATLRLEQRLQNEHDGYPYSVGIEAPAGKHGRDKLLPILGAVTAALEPHGPNWWTPSAWRKAIGCEGKAINTKQGGHERVHFLLWTAHGYDAAARDEHEMDAFGLALAQHTFITRSEAA